MCGKEEQPTWSDAVKKFNDSNFGAESSVNRAQFQPDNTPTLQKIRQIKE